MSILCLLLFLSSTQITWFELNAFKVQAVAQQPFNDKISLTAWKRHSHFLLLTMIAATILELALEPCVALEKDSSATCQEREPDEASRWRIGCWSWWQLVPGEGQSAWAGCGLLSATLLPWSYPSTLSWHPSPCLCPTRLTKTGKGLVKRVDLGFHSSSWTVLCFSSWPNSICYEQTL